MPPVEPEGEANLELSDAVAELRAIRGRNARQRRTGCAAGEKTAARDVGAGKVTETAGRKDQAYDRCARCGAGSRKWT